MRQSGRYGRLEDMEFEPGSGRKVLKNLMGIKTKREMDQHETVALKQAEDSVFKTYTRQHCFTAKDICSIHRIWLGRIYSWAGQYRSIDLTKGIRFAHAAHIPNLMEEFEVNFLKIYTPCIFEKRERVIRSLAEVHTELILIHPFQEGNGRIARVLSTLMALQAGLPPLNFNPIKGKKKQEYFKAVQAGLDRNYKPMEKVFEEVIDKTISRLRK